MPKLIDLVSKPKTRVALIVDKSGSMSSLSKFVVDTYNEQLAELRSNADTQDISVSLIFFDSEIEVRCFNEPIETIKDLSYDDYQPGTMTALNDAIGLTVDKFKRLEGYGDEDLSHLVVIITDGIENASTEYPQKTISNIISKLQTEQWTFTYLGANVDIEKVSKDYGIFRGNLTNYQATEQGMTNGSARTTRGLSKFLGARAAGVTTTKAFYENKEEDFVDLSSFEELNKDATPLKIR